MPGVMLVRSILRSPTSIVALAAGALLLLGVAAADGARAVTPKDHRAAAERLRLVAPKVQVSVSIALRHDAKGLLARVSGTKAKKGPQRGIVRRHGARTADVRAVVRWARSQGLKAEVGRLRTRVIVHGSAERMSRAFRVKLYRYRSPSGRTYIAVPRTIEVPRAIRWRARGVAGLSHVPSPKHVSSEGSAVPAHGPSTPSCANSPFFDLSGSGSGTPITPMTPLGMAQAYGFDGVATGTSYPPQTIAIMELDQSYDRKDVSLMQKHCRFGEGSAPVSVKAINLPGAQVSAEAENNLEANLDTQLVAALAPAGTKVVVINVSSNSATPFADFFEKAASLKHLTAISISYGISETVLTRKGVATAVQELSQADTHAQMLAARGVSIFVSSGDQGSMGPPADVCASNFPMYGLPGQVSVNWPASSVAVTAVGGTMWNSTTRSVADEQVWNEVASVTGMAWPCGVAGGGGGQSVMFPRPKYQTGVAIAGKGRLVPDVALLAGEPGYIVVMSGDIMRVEGTSASAPLLASAILRINAERRAQGKPAVGQLNQLLYDHHRLGAEIQDVTVGNNDIFKTGLCCSAGPGFDMASGLGTPKNIGNWLAHIP